MFYDIGFLYDHVHTDETQIYITPVTENHTARTEAAQFPEEAPYITMTHSRLRPFSAVSIFKIVFRFVYAS